MTKYSNSSLIRAYAARALKSVCTENQTIDWLTNNRPKWVESPLAQELIYGVLRHHFSLAAFIDSFLTKPLRNKDRDVYELMLVGAYQLINTRIPDHAVINESVAALQPLQKPWAKGLVNAVLRQASNSEKRSNLWLTSGDESTVELSEQSFDHPDWMITGIVSSHPALARSIMFANNTKAPMCLRINSRLISRDDYCQMLLASEIAHSQGQPNNSIILTRAQPSASLPGWSKGLVSVQDAGAQYAAELLLTERWGSKPEQTEEGRVLDACAAPGGKLAHLFELMQNLANWEIIGVDSSPNRLSTTRDILARLGHRIDLVEGDVATQQWWSGQPFSHILLDAPCSGTGTLRHHPEIKLLLDESSIASHQLLQARILNNLWQTLAPGGTLLYCTCSLLEEENDGVVGPFINDNKNAARLSKFELPTGTATQYGWQLLPTDPSTDGFYYALLHKH